MVLTASILSCSIPQLCRPYIPLLSHASSRRKHPRFRASKLLATAVYSPHPNFDTGDHANIVDANMTVLRKRIEAVKRQETLQGGNSRSELPQEWMQWEKDYYSFYQEEICLVMACLQYHLLASRPIVSLSILVTATVCVPLAGIYTLSAITSSLVALVTVR